jgi:post-segregation antitoxin (ccd killing protein)
MRMPKMQVYLPSELYEQVKARSDQLNVSALLQDALAERLAQLDRLDAARAALAEYEAEFGVITPEEIAARLAADEAEAERNRELIRRWMT